MQRLRTNVTAALLEDVTRRLGAVVGPDGGPPLFQGAVGQVVGLRCADGSSYVVKTYPQQDRRRAATESLALRLLRGGEGVPVPEVVTAGALDGDQPLTYLVLTRIAGVRWADRRGQLGRRHHMALHRTVGRMLRRLHALPGEEFGDLLDDGFRWPTAWARIDARCDELVEEHLRAGGPIGIAHRVRRLVDDHRGAVSSCRAPVLCHNDFIDGNILVAAAGAPWLRGVVDLERASWDDPLADLARTRLHAYQHDPGGADVLAAAYGVEGDQERHRVAVHEVLHALRERSWIAWDRPSGWQRSIAALDAFVTART